MTHSDALFDSTELIYLPHFCHCFHDDDDDHLWTRNRCKCTDLLKYDVITWKRFRYYWPFLRITHRSLVDSLHKGQWWGTLMIPMMPAWKNSRRNYREAGELKYLCTHLWSLERTIWIWIWQIYLRTSCAISFLDSYFPCAHVWNFIW